jgi:hypothetical protein
VDLVKDIPRSTYYYWEKRLNQADKYTNIKEDMKEIYHEHKGRYGYCRIAKELKKKGIHHDPKTILRLANEGKIKRSKFSGILNLDLRSCLKISV